MQKREKRLCGGETHSRFLPASVGGPTLPGPKLALDVAQGNRGHLESWLRQF